MKRFPFGIKEKKIISHVTVLSNINGKEIKLGGCLKAHKLLSITYIVGNKNQFDYIHNFNAY